MHCILDHYSEELRWNSGILSCMHGLLLRPLTLSVTLQGGLGWPGQICYVCLSIVCSSAAYNMVEQLNGQKLMAIYHKISRFSIFLVDFQKSNLTVVEQPPASC